MFKRFLTLTALFTLAAFAHAKGSSNPGMGQPSESGFVPYEQAQRVFVFPHSRNMNTNDAKLYVCPFDMETGDKWTCTKKDDNSKISQWIELPAITPAGYEISTYNFSFVGTQGWRVLTVFYRKAAKSSP